MWITLCDINSELSCNANLWDNVRARGGHRRFSNHRSWRHCSGRSADVDTTDYLIAPVYVFYATFTNYVLLIVIFNRFSNNIKNWLQIFFRSTQH